jgi:hypothetical protein
MLPKLLGTMHGRKPAERQPAATKAKAKAKAKAKPTPPLLGYHSKPSLVSGMSVVRLCRRRALLHALERSSFLCLQLEEQMLTGFASFGFELFAYSGVVEASSNEAFLRNASCKVKPCGLFR